MVSPKYKPKDLTIKNAFTDYKIYRNSCSNFGKKAKLYVLKRDGDVCSLCNSKKDLQIDHIISCCYGFRNKIDLIKINDLTNLRILCKTCNTKLQPLEVFYGKVD